MLGRTKIYPPKEGLTADELTKGHHWLYTDIECPHCGYNQAVANTQYVGGPCMRCGELTGKGKDE